MDFPPSYIVDPTHDVAHSHTIILLHGRGSTAREFANDLFLLKTSKQGGNLRDTFPSVRWVFPDAGQRWCTVFQEKRSAWFDTASLDDLSLSQDLQLPGLCNGIQLAAKIMESEVDRLGGRSDHVILGGFSQGSAVALWSLFTGVAGLKGCLGAFVGFSAWMPFTKEAMDFITSGTQESVPSRYGALREGFGKILEAGWTASIPSVQIAAGMPVYLGHGVDVSKLAQLPNDCAYESLL